MNYAAMVFAMAEGFMVADVILWTTIGHPMIGAVWGLAMYLTWKLNQWGQP